VLRTRLRRRIATPLRISRASDANRFNPIHAPRYVAKRTDGRLRWAHNRSLHQAANPFRLQLVTVSAPTWARSATRMTTPSSRQRDCFAGIGLNMITGIRDAHPTH
jgi:hypothetical protein